MSGVTMTDDFDTFVGPCEIDPPPAEPRWRWYALGAASAIAIIGVVVATWLVGWLIDERRTATVDLAQQQLTALAEGKAESLRIWLDGLAKAGNGIARSELVSLFMTERSLATNDQALAMALSEQEPYLRVAIDALARDHDLVGAYLLANNGQIIMRDPDAERLPVGETTRLADLAGSDAFAMFRRDGDRLLLDVLRPIPSTLSIAGGGAVVAGHLMMTTDVSNGLAALLRPGAAPAHATLALNAPSASVPLTIRSAPASTDFGSSTSVDATGLEIRVAASPTEVKQTQNALTYQATVAGTDWIVDVGMPLGPLLQPIDSLARTSRYLAIAIGIGLTLAATALFWRQRARQNRLLVEQYRQLAQEIARRGALLRTVIRGTSDLILVRDAASDEVRFLNPSLMRALGNGASWQGRPHGRLKTLAEAADTAGDASPCAIDIGGASRWLHVHHTLIEGQRPPDPLGNEFGDGAPDRMRLTIARDVTALVDSNRRHQRTIDQTVNALTRAIELADPYLDGHSARVRAVGVQLAETLDLSVDERRTLEQAAALSQIGKLFVPQDLLTKPERHDELEAAAMRQHIIHALRIIQPIDFELPVAEALACLHERLDGTGYPNRLHGDDISEVSRVLAVSDVFCARIRPRSYRDAITPAEACRILLGLPERYDADVVAALDRCLASGALLHALELDEAMMTGEMPEFDRDDQVELTSSRPANEELEPAC